MEFILVAATMLHNICDWVCGVDGETVGNVTGLMVGLYVGILDGAEDGTMDGSINNGVEVGAAPDAQTVIVPEFLVDTVDKQLA
jgi:hypothetical protein